MLTTHSTYREVEIVASVEVLMSHWVGEQVSERSFIGVLGTQMEKQLKEMFLCVW